MTILEVVNSCTDHYRLVSHARGVVAIRVANNAMDFHSTNGMFHLDPLLGDGAADESLFRWTGLPVGLFRGQVKREEGRPVAQVPLISDTGAPGWERGGILFQQHFIMHVPGRGCPDKDDLPSAAVRDHGVFHSMPFDLATEVIISPVSVDRPSDRALGGVNKEGQRGTAHGQVREGGSRAGRQDTLPLQGGFEDGEQAMNPCTGLGLAEPKEHPLEGLNRIETDIDENEEELLRERWQCAFLASSRCPLTASARQGDTVGRAVCDRECLEEVGEFRGHESRQGSQAGGMVEDIHNGHCDTVPAPDRDDTREGAGVGEGSVIAYILFYKTYVCTDIY